MSQWQPPASASDLCSSSSGGLSPDRQGPPLRSTGPVLAGEQTAGVSAKASSSSSPQRMSQERGGGPWPRLLRPRRSSAFTRRAHPRPQPPPRWAVMLSFTFSARSLPSPSHTLCQKEVTSANFPRGRPLPAHLQKRLHDLNNLTRGEVCPPACGRLRVRTCAAPAPGAATPRPPCRGGRSRCELVPKENRMRL